MSEYTDDDRLKHCPFCGGEAEFEELKDEANFGGLVVTCLACLACSRVQFGEGRMNLLLEAWNRRKCEEANALESRVRELEFFRKAEAENCSLLMKKLEAAEGRVRELEAEVGRLREAIERAPCHDFCREAKARHYIPYTEHHHACWKVEALRLEGQDYMRPALQGEG